MLSAAALLCLLFQEDRAAEAAEAADKERPLKASLLNYGLRATPH